MLRYRENRIRWVLVGLGILIALGFILSFNGCDRIIDSGEFRGLKIGMHKSSVTELLQKKNINTIFPQVDTPVVLKGGSSLEDVARLGGSEGICITDNAGFSINIAFDEAGSSELIYRSANVDLNSLGLESAGTRVEVLAVVKELMKSKDNLTASACIADISSIRLDSVSQENKDLIRRFNRWLYYVPDSFSTVVLQFEGDTLVQIEHRWRLFER